MIFKDQIFISKSPEPGFLHGIWGQAIGSPHGDSPPIDAQIAWPLAEVSLKQKDQWLAAGVSFLCTFT